MHFEAVHLDQTFLPRSRPWLLLLLLFTLLPDRLPAHGADVVILDPFDNALQMKYMLFTATQLTYLLICRLLEILKAYGALVDILLLIFGVESLG